MFGRCPVCGGEMEVARLYCPGCRTSIEGHFQSCKFCQLSREQMEFLDTFIMCRGNIKEVERELGISYPTVRSRLDTVIQALGHPVDRAKVAEDQEAGRQRRLEVLESLAEGKIDAEEAVRRLRREG